MQKVVKKESIMGELSTNGCSHKHTHILSKPQIKTCFSWSLIYHTTGESGELKDTEEVEKGIHIIQAYLEHIQTLGEVQLHFYRNQYNFSLVF